MTASYVLRFDDLTPWMNWTVWDQIEPILNELEIRPIAAVVPLNADPNLVVGPPNEEFWKRVRTWQRNGWTIGMHGFEHRHVTDSAGIVGINSRSEFAGLPREDQEEKLRAAAAVFASERVCPEVWVAPNHSFDAGTIAALSCVGVMTISDGLGLKPYRTRDDMMWVPHQLWRFRRMPFGVWTVGIHLNAWKHEQLSGFLRDLRTFREQLVDFPTVCHRYRGRRRTWYDAAAAAALLTMIRTKRRARSLHMLHVSSDAY